MKKVDIQRHITNLLLFIVYLAVLFIIPANYVNILYPAALFPSIIIAFLLGPWAALAASLSFTGINLFYLLINIPGYLPEGLFGFVLGHLNIIFASSAVGYISRIKKKLHRMVRQKEKSEEKLTELLHQKDMMVREMNHRISNNLNMLSGLIELQSQFMSDKEYQHKFLELKNKIVTIALLHNQLQENSKDLDMDTRPYLKTLVSRITKSLLTEHCNILVHTQEIEGVYLPSSYSTHLGLIVSELVTNAFKYAFPAEESGNIWIKLKPTLDGSSIQLSVSNNGVPFDFRAKAASEGVSLGMTLIESLTEQLKGNFQIRQEEGIVVFYITFPKPENAVYIEEQDAKPHPNSYR